MLKKTLDTALLYVTHRDKCHRISVTAENILNIFIVKLQLWNFSQEEADTRLLLHAYQAKQLFEKITIRSPDTDVFMFCLTSTLILVLEIEDIKKCESSIGADRCRALTGFHIFTGFYQTL